MSTMIQGALPVAEPNEVAATSESKAGKNPADILPWLPCTASLEIPLFHFTIGDLSKLAKGTVVTTACHHTSDIPLHVNGQLIGWTEFEVINERLAVRITEIA